MFMKICGITRLDDALHAAEQGATALGFIFWPGSPRYIAPDAAAAIIDQLPDTVQPVGVFVNEEAQSIRAIVDTARLKTVQLHGQPRILDLGALEVVPMRAMNLDEVATTSWPVQLPVVLDAIDGTAWGGTGRTIDWDRAAEVAKQREVVLAGGLTPANVGEAIRRVRPYGVDVSSGVEQSPGIKDKAKVTEFLANAKAAFESCQ